jgi:UTP--glucose-1-phosphate uridylyltransferase
MIKQPIRKAVFPVAGLGTRFLPATKASPKEMLSVVDKPLIQYAVEEAVHSGIEQIIFVTGSSKRAIEDHFDSNFELEELLQRKGKKALLDLVRNILPSHVSLAYVRQPQALGWGHAVLCAEDVIGHEPFAVLLPDDLMGGHVPALKQLISVFHEERGSVFSVKEVPRSQVKQYGIIDPVGSFSSGGSVRIKGIIEKPEVGTAPSNFCVLGRYILTPRILTLLKKITPGAGGEMQMTDAIALLLKEEPVFASEYKGVHYDCGTKLGFLQATVQYGLKHPEIGQSFRAYLKDQVMTDIESRDDL